MKSGWVGSSLKTHLDIMFSEHVAVVIERIRIMVWRP